MKQVELFTDGGCIPNPGMGAWACVLIYNGVRKELFATEPISDTTNNRMELQAVIEGLKALKEPCQVTVVCDSQLVVNGGAGRWKRNANKDLWEQFDFAALRHEVTFEWIRGHTGYPENERCHMLVQEVLA